MPTFRVLIQMGLVVDAPSAEIAALAAMENPPTRPERCTALLCPDRMESCAVMVRSRPERQIEVMEVTREQ